MKNFLLILFLSFGLFITPAVSQDFVDESLFEGVDDSNANDPFSDPFEDGDDQTNDDPFSDPFGDADDQTDDPFSDPFGDDQTDDPFSDPFGDDQANDPFSDPLGGGDNQANDNPENPFELAEDNSPNTQSGNQDFGGFSESGDPNQIQKRVENIVDGLYTRNDLREKKFRPQTALYEIDVLWSKRLWRTIDMRQKLNHYFYYPEITSGDKKNLINILMDGVIEEKFFAFSPISDDFSLEMTAEEIKAIGSSIDTIPVLDPITQERSLKVIKNEFNRQDVRKYRIKEDWFVDKTRSKMDVRIIGICPIVEVIDEETGEFRGNKPLFWIYFPSLRRVMVKHVAPSFFNDSDKKTYDEIFLKRIFASFIYKESNVQDKIIQDYAQGLDALYESEKIQYDLISLEESLWHY